MRNIRKYTFLAALLCCAAVAKADGQTISHNFHSKFYASPSQMEITSGNRLGTTDDDFVYTCSGTSAEFGGDLLHGIGYQVIAINLPKSGSQVVVSPPIDRLDSLRIFYYYPNTYSPYEGVKIALSTDGIEWEELLSGSQISYHHLGTSSGYIGASFAQDAYYIKIWNTSNQNVSLISIEYHISPCTNCFRYRP